MTTKTRKILTYTAVALMLGGLGLYASMEDYQKQNMAKFFSQTFA